MGAVWHAGVRVTPGSARPVPAGDPATTDLARGLTCPRSHFLFYKMGLCLSAELLGGFDGNPCTVFSRAPDLYQATSKWQLPRGWSW